MKSVILFTLLCVALCEVSSLTPANSQYVTTQQSISSTDAQLQTLYDTLKNLRTNTYRDEYMNTPMRPAAPQTLSAITQLTTNMRKLRKSLLKPAEEQPGQSPEEMMLYHKLLSGLKRTSRSSHATPAMRPASQEQLDALSRLTQQLHDVSSVLESPETNALHRQAHGQSRLLHRMTHVMDAMSGEMSASRQRHYESLLNTLLDQHLSDPDYHDSLHDHLLAHHLLRSTRDGEFTDHLTHHMLYNSLDNALPSDGALSSRTGAVLSAPLRAELSQAQDMNASELTAASQQFAQTSAAENAALLSQLGQRTNNQYAYAQQ